MKNLINATTGSQIPYTLVSMAAILRDYADMSDWYKNDLHEKLTDIADSLYNVGIAPDEFKTEYKELYDQYGKAYFDKVLDDMDALDGQLTSDAKVQELADDYADRLDGVTASTKVSASSDYDTKTIARYLKAKFDDEAFGTAYTMHRISNEDAYMGRNKLSYNRRNNTIDRIGNTPEEDTPIFKVVPQYSSTKRQGTYAPKMPKLVPIDEWNATHGVTASTRVTATEDNSYNQHLVQVSKEDKQYVLNNLNNSHKTVGMGGAGDPGYYVSEFEPAYGLYLWASDTGLRILDDNGIQYELVKKSVESSTVKASSGQSFEYQLLDRLKSDCEYVLAEYRRSETQGDSSREGRKLAQKFLWANNAKDQIAKMKELYRKLKVKPEWITLEDIAEYERQFKEILGKDYRGDHEYVGASNNPFYDKLSDYDKRIVDNQRKQFSPITFDVYNALLPYIGEYASNTGWTGSCELMRVKDNNTADGYLYKVIWDDGHDIDIFSWQVNDNPRVGGDFTLMVMPAHGMPDFCDSEKDFYRAVRKVFGDGLKKIN